MAKLSNADRARLAHRVLRLKEGGIASEAALRAEAGGAATDSNEIFAAGAATRGRIALATMGTLDADLPGPTDRKEVERLFGMTLTDIWKVWDECVKLNLQETLDPKEFAKLERSWRKDERAALKAQEAAEAAGEFPVHPYFGHNRHELGAANALYDKGREGFLDGSIDWDTATIKVDLVDSADYTVNLSTHQFFSSVSSAHGSVASVAQSAAFASKTVTAGVADADDIVLTAVSGDPSEALVIYQSSAVGGGADVAVGSQRLIGYIDTATGLPVTPNGGNINIAWDSGSNRIFKL